MYLTGTITAPVFCDEFYYSYSLEIGDDDLTELEQETFSELDKISSRFSEFEEDHIKYPGGFYTEAELLQKILETKEKLKKQSPI